MCLARLGVEGRAAQDRNGGQRRRRRWSDLGETLLGTDGLGGVGEVDGSENGGVDLGEVEVCSWARDVLG